MRLSAAILLLSLGSSLSAENLIESNEVLTQTLPVNVERHRVIVLSTEPMMLSAGDLLDVRYQIAVTSEHPKPVMIGREIRYSKNPSKHPGKILIPAVASNLTKEEHHGVIQGSKLIEIEETAQNVTVYLTLWANRHEEASAHLVVHEDGAFLQVLKVH